jgi:hypothetical protein
VLLQRQLQAEKNARFFRKFLLIGGGVAAVVVVGVVVYFATRDTWERDNAARLATLKAEGSAALATGDLKAAYVKCEEVLSSVGDRKLTLPEVKEIKAWAENGKRDIVQKLEAIRVHEDEERAEAKRRAESERLAAKQREEQQREESRKAEEQRKAEEERGRAAENERKALEEKMHAAQQRLAQEQQRKAEEARAARLRSRVESFKDAAEKGISTDSFCLPGIPRLQVGGNRTVKVDMTALGYDFSPDGLAARVKVKGSSADAAVTTKFEQVWVYRDVENEWYVYDGEWELAVAIAAKPQSKLTEPQKTRLNGLDRELRRYHLALQASGVAVDALMARARNISDDATSDSLIRATARLNVAESLLKRAEEMNTCVDIRGHALGLAERIRGGKNGEEVSASSRPDPLGTVIDLLKKPIFSPCICQNAGSRDASSCALCRGKGGAESNFNFGNLVSVLEDAAAK